MNDADTISKLVTRLLQAQYALAIRRQAQDTATAAVSARALELRRRVVMLGQPMAGGDRETVADVEAAIAAMGECP